ncbi:MAG: PilX N-terminal domain-containing pilus assembly protein, partial [Candidatus Methylomirabilales bacterium]
MTTRRRPKRLIPIRDERGMALVVALWVTVMLFLLGVAFLGVSGLESSIASNEVKTATAFHLADAGVEHARRALINLGPSAVLGGASVFAGSNTA